MNHIISYDVQQILKFKFMGKALKLAHILFPLSITTLYIFFIFLLSHSIVVSAVISVIFIMLFFIYFITIYTLFHSKPGFLTYNSAANKMGVENICVYKQNEQRKQQILSELNKNHTHQQLKQLQAQYAQLYIQYSFCDTCEIVKIPRSFHCLECDRCVLRRQKHSNLLGFCIGQKNMRQFMQYLFVTIILVGFMTFSLLLVVVFQRDQIQKVENTTLVFFAVLEMALGTCLALFIKEFVITYSNAIENLTQTERKMQIINKKNNPFSGTDYYHTLFKGFCDYFNVGSGPNPSYWIELQEQN